MKSLRKFSPIVKGATRLMVNAMLLIFIAMLIFVTASAVIVRTLADWPIVVGLGVIFLGLFLMPVTALLIFLMRALETQRQRIEGVESDIAHIDARLPGHKLPM
jgi:hypothetical protein